MEAVKKHILVISQYFYPEEFRINDICSEWVKRGYKVTVLTGIPNYPQGQFYEGYDLEHKRTEKWNGIRIVRIPLSPRGHGAVGMASNYFSFVVSGFIWKTMTNIKPDYIFMFEVSPMTQCKIGVWLKEKLRKEGLSVPLYAYIQDLWPDNVEMVTGIHSPLIIKPIEQMVKKIYQACDAIFATSPSFVEEIIKRGADRKKVHYWPQYAEEFYYPRERKMRDDFSEDDRLRVMFTGNIGQAQGLEILPKAAELLKNEKIRFYIVGDGRNRENLERAIKERDVQEMFRFLGRRPATEIPDLLACADVAFLSFSNDELFAKTIPAKLQSYMACGMPIVASAKGETARIIEEAQCGICTEIGNKEALADGIRNLINLSPDALCRYGDNAVNYFKQHFKKKELMDEIDKYYR